MYNIYPFWSTQITACLKIAPENCRDSAIPLARYHHVPIPNPLEKRRPLAFGGDDDSTSADDRDLLSMGDDSRLSDRTLGGDAAILKRGSRRQHHQTFPFHLNSRFVHVHLGRRQGRAAVGHERHVVI